MRHLQSGRKLNVDSSHRVALMRSMTLALIENESIRTIPARAKELRWWAEHIVTLAKRGDLSSRRRIIQLLGSTKTPQNGENRIRSAVEAVYSRLVPRFKERSGGYTQILRLATRRPGDNAELCVMRYLPPPEEKKARKAPAKATKKVKADSRKKAEDKPSDKREGKAAKKSKAKDKE